MVPWTSSARRLICSFHLTTLDFHITVMPQRSSSPLLGRVFLNQEPSQWRKIYNQDYQSSQHLCWRSIIIYTAGNDFSPGLTTDKLDFLIRNNQEQLFISNPPFSFQMYLPLVSARRKKRVGPRKWNRLPFKDISSAKQNMCILHKRTLVFILQQLHYFHELYKSIHTFYQNSKTHSLHRLKWAVKGD